MTPLVEQPGALSQQRLVRHIPFALTTLRLALAPAICLLAFYWPNSATLSCCVIVGVLSDIFDGVIARRLDVATARLRRYDSATDILFFLAILAGIWIAHRRIVILWAPEFGVLLLLEIACQCVSLLRFGSLPATHAYTAKVWGLSLCVASVAMLAFGYAGPLIWGMVLLGMIADLEVLAILLLSPRSPVDVKSVWTLLRKRKPLRVE